MIFYYVSVKCMPQEGKDCCRLFTGVPQHLTECLVQSSRSIKIFGVNK